MISKQEVFNASILIVDDQQSNVILLTEMLHDAGYACIASTTDPYAVSELHRQNHYDLIVLDLLMPGMDGFEVMEGLKKVEIDAYLSVLVITAQPDHKLKALAAGAKDFLTKPFNLTEVVTRIYNMLEVRLLYKKLEQHNKLLELKVLERTAELQTSEERFRCLTKLSSDWYWEQNETGAFTQVYGPALEMLGILSNGESCKTDDQQGEQWIEAEREILEANLAARQPFLDYVYSRVNSDGSRQYFMVSGEPMFNLSGRFLGYRGIGKDVTETLSAKNEAPAKR
jgi:PAS domain S-box-containing protein